LAAIEIEKVLNNLKKKYRIRVLEKQLKVKLLDYFKSIALEDSIWCRECECPHEERGCLYFRRAAIYMAMMNAWRHMPWLRGVIE
jgi:hypothetical protein